MNLFVFGPFQLDARALVLSVDGKPLALGPRVVATLLALVERPGELLKKDELLDRVWDGADVEESNLAQNVYVLRKTLRAHWAAPAIETVPRRGYRFVGAVRRIDAVERTSPIRSVRVPVAGNLLRRLAAAAVLCTATIAIATAARGVRPGPPPLSAYGSAFYQLGHDHLNLRTKSGFTNSARYFLAVTRSDPASPLGYAGLAAAYALMPGYGVSVPPPRVAMRRAWAYAHVALVRDDASSEAHAALGYLQHQSGKRSDAGELELERAVALDPRNASAHVWLGGVLYERGLTARARKEFETAETLEPASPAAESWLASVLFLSREYAAAAEHLRRALDVDPSREDALKQLGTVAAQLGDSRLLLSALGRLQNACHCTAYVTIIRAYAYAKMHHAAAARVALAAALREAPPGKLTADVAFVYAALGDRRRAVAWLRRAQRDEPSEVALLARDPRLDPLRHDVDFQRWTRAARADT